MSGVTALVLTGAESIQREDMGVKSTMDKEIKMKIQKCISN